MNYLSEEQIEDFFRKYLAIFGVDGGRNDFAEIKNWFLTGYYPTSFQKIWPIEKRWGYYPIINGEAIAHQLANQITDSRNFLPAIESYRKQCQA